MNEEKTQNIYVIDDDVEFAKSVRFLLSFVEQPVVIFPNAETFLKEISPDASGCILVDVRMPGMSGLQLQKILAQKRPDLPVIIMTAHGDIDMAVGAMKDGAMDFLQKPFNDQRLIDLINKAMMLNRDAEEKRRHSLSRDKRLKDLTARENEVLGLIVDGNTNKEIAYQLGISDKTVEVHRARIMDKTGARSIQDLMKLVFAISETE